MEGYLVARYVVIGVIVAGVAFLAGRGIFREFRTAITKDAKEKKPIYFRAKLAEYGIVVLVGIIALIAVSYLKNGPLKPWSEALYGKTQTIDSPLLGGNSK